MNDTSWSPDRKIVAAAVATIAVWLAQATLTIDVPPGVEGAIAVLVGYLIPSQGGEGRADG